ncbi:MAG: hypothetical protein QME85_04475 [Candidatus Saccharicenans sp.]|nr:hypothetical protein [Candidatus Saccharicenans sp.]MDI6848514.1 hypothetical protein [Candidatus Saccharicenans sp.]
MKNSQENVSLKSSRRSPSLVALLLLVGGLLPWAQSCRQTSQTEVIRDLLRSVAGLAEKKDPVKIIEHLGDEYRDFEGRDRRQTLSLLEYYFKNYRGIVIHLLDIYVDINENRAEVEADVLLSSGPLENLRKLVGLVGVYYRFDFQLEKKENRWKISYAAWREVDENSLLPGSRLILKKYL